MNSNFFLFLLQFSIFCKQYYVSNGNPLVGYEIENVQNNEYSFTTAIVEYNNLIPQADCIICTGALISLYHVLTSAHCIEDVQDIVFGVLAESNFLQHNILHHPNWWITYDQWATIMNIDLRYPQNDVAVIKLIQSVGNNVIPAPISNIQNYNALSGEDIVLVGWGESNNEDIPDILQSGTLKIITNEECSNLASELQGWRIRIPTRYICTRADPLIRLLGGDCGGPILYQGSIIGVSKGVFPTDQELCDDAVNFHVGIHYYIGFITHLLAL